MRVSSFSNRAKKSSGSGSVSLHVPMGKRTLDRIPQEESAI